MTKTINVSGGFLGGKHIENKIVIGDLSNSFLINKISEWETFKSTYYKNNKLNPKYYSKLLNVINYICILPGYTVDENKLLYGINTIYKASTNEIINAINRYIDIYSPIKMVLKHLFMNYKTYIENLILLFMRLNEGDSDDAARWNIIDAENNLNSSSPILLINFPPPEIKLEKDIPRINWHVKDAKINKMVIDFLAAIKKRKFVYLGFCPFIPIKRLQLLLDFPAGKLVKILKAMGHTISNNIADKIKKLKYEIKPLNIDIKKTDVYNHKKFENMSVDKKIKHFETYIDAYINLYKTVMPHVSKTEKYINNFALKINDISNDILNLVS